VRNWSIHEVGLIGGQPPLEVGKIIMQPHYSRVYFIAGE